MKIIKHGNTVAPSTIGFVCECGCEFEAEQSEYKTYEQDFSSVPELCGHREANEDNIWVVFETECPECKTKCKTLRKR